MRYALTHLKMEWGLNIEVEAQGGWNVYTPVCREQYVNETDEAYLERWNRPRKVIYRTHPMKLPTCPREGDGDKLQQSVFPGHIRL